MFCVRCGTQNVIGAACCASCGVPLAGAAAQASEAADPATAALQAPIEYAGFWRRFVAFIIDSILIQIAFAPIQAILESRFGVDPELLGEIDPEQLFASEEWSMFLAYFGIVFIVGTGINWLYFGLMESSSKQATVGKMALGMKVTDLGGNRLSFARATGRYLAKFVSSLILAIGYIMAGFTAKKQALHDIIASTLVVRVRE